MSSSFNYWLAKVKEKEDGLKALEKAKSQEKEKCKIRVKIKKGLSIMVDPQKAEDLNKDDIIDKLGL